jgi:hypothetical protein
MSDSDDAWIAYRAATQPPAGGLCARCGHDPHWHRLDDTRNVGPTDPRAVFRCLGVTFEGCDCPDFVERERRDRE